MAEYRVSFTYFKRDAKGNRGSGSSTQATVAAPTDMSAMNIIASRYPGKEIEWRKIVKVK